MAYSPYQEEVLNKWDAVIEVLRDLTSSILVIAVDQSQTDLKNLLRETGCYHKSHDTVVRLFRKYCNGLGF